MNVAGFLARLKPEVGGGDHSDDVSLLNELNWGYPLFPGVFANIDGSLMFGWEIRGRDPGGLDQDEKNQIANELSAIVAPLRGGYIIHIDQVRRESQAYLPDAPWPDRTSALIEEERRRMSLYAVPYFESRHFITVTVLGPPDLTGRVAQLFRDTDTPVGPEEIVQQRLKTILRKIELFEASLRDVYPSVAPLGNRLVKDDRAVTLIENDFARYLRFCTTGLDHPIRYHPSDIDMVADLVAATEYEMTGRVKAGSKHIKTVTVIKLPTSGTYAGMTQFLDELQVPSRVVSRYITLTQDEAMAIAEKARSKAATGRFNWLNTIRHMAGGNPTHVNPNASAEEADALGALAEASSPFMSFGHLTQTITFYDEDLFKVEQAALDTVKILGSFGYTGWVDEVGAPDAFIGTLPGHGNQALRRLPVNSVNFADLVPTTTVYTGPEKHPNPLYPLGSPVLMRIRTTGATPYNLVLHEEELGFAIVIGPTRTGKTFLANCLRHAQMRYSPNGIYNLDYDSSAEVATYAFGGDYIRLDESLGPVFAPWQNVREDELWCKDYAETLVRADGLPVDYAVRKEVDEIVRLLKESENPSFTLVAQIVQGKPQLRELFDSYVNGMLDAERDTLDLRALDQSKFVSFDFTPLTTQSHQRRLATIMYLFRKIELALTGRPNAFFVEEAHIPMGDELIVPRFEQMTRRAAKANLLFVLLTQSLKEMHESPLFPLILDSFKTQIFLANAKAFEPANYKLYSDFGLNDAQIREIAEMTPRRDYYIVSPRGSRRVTIEPGPVALAFLAVGDKPRIRRVRELRAEFPDDWQPRWLRELAEKNPAQFGACYEAADAWYHGDHNERYQSVNRDLHVSVA